MSYLLKLFHDELSPNSIVTPGLESQHTIIYLWKGSTTINSELVKMDSAVYCEDFAAIQAGLNADGPVIVEILTDPTQT